MLLVPDITAGTGTEFQETLVRSGSGGLSQSEGAQERVLSVDGVLCRGPSHLGVGRPSIYTTSGRRYGRNPRPNRHPGHFPRCRFHGPDPLQARARHLAGPGYHARKKLRSPLIATPGPPKPQRFEQTIKALLEAVGCILGQNLGSRMKILVRNMSRISPSQLALPKGRVRIPGSRRSSLVQMLPDRIGLSYFGRRRVLVCFDYGMGFRSTVDVCVKRSDNECHN